MPAGDNVRQEVSNEGDIAINEGVAEHKLVKVGALKDQDVLTSIVKVNSERILEVAFSQLNVDIVISGRANGW